jgi:tetratricopeptide (TPR) repeat protein
LAEACLAQGDRAGAQREFDQAERTSDARAKREVLTWHGEVLLWMGEYRGAVRRFDAAILLGAEVFVYGWRGAARLKLGQAAQAVADLDRAVALDPKDFEALVWRGEANRILGRHDDALRDLDAAIEGGHDRCWAYFNRALIRGSRGDEAGMAADFAQIPREVIAFVRGRLRLRQSRPLSAVQMRKVLTAGLGLARGIRRDEAYLKSLWMRRA